MATFWDESDEPGMDVIGGHWAEIYGISGSVGGEVGNWPPWIRYVNWSEFDDESDGEEKNGLSWTGTTVDPKRLITNRHGLCSTCFVLSLFLGVFLFISMSILVCPYGNFLRGIRWGQNGWIWKVYNRDIRDFWVVWPSDRKLTRVN